jgi:aldose 1-epimerase
MKKAVLYFITISLSLIYSCQSNKETGSMIEKKLFGRLNDGTEVYEFTLQNPGGMRVKIINYGAIVMSIEVPDRNGKLGDVILGYDDLDGYINDNSYQGAIVGRYGNRIAKGKFTLEDIEHQVTVNDGENHLHGGRKGFFKSIWNVEPIKSETDPALKLTYLSPDGEEGYPGNVNIEVIYTITEENALKIEYTGTTDKITILNPTHHSYFNLKADPNKTILDNELMINADKTTEVGAGLIPTGKLVDVENTPMDFRTPTKIGARINADDAQLKLGFGYDHNWVLNNFDKQIRKAVELYDSSTGRLMEIFTDQPGMQFYSGNFLDGTIKGKKGISYQYRTGLCLEAQLFPDSPNKPDFPSATLKPGEKYSQTTIYKFSVK